MMEYWNNNKTRRVITNMKCFLPQHSILPLFQFFVGGKANGQIIDR